MAVPKRKKSRSRAASRKAAWKAGKTPAKSECPQCHAPKLPHRACPSCGTYAGREIIQVD
jgi:large subunit ribosomal protein L32